MTEERGTVVAPVEHKLGPLPEPDCDHYGGVTGRQVVSRSYSAKSMLTYAAQEVAAERERWTKAIGAQMPADFKDWHENSPAELPEIAAWVIQNLRADRDSWADQASQRAQDALDLVAAERERIAKLIEGYPHWLGQQARREIAAAIRSA